MAKNRLFQVTESDRAKADQEIKHKRQEVKYDLRDFTIDHIVQQFRDDLFYVPDYQREFIWRTRHKCRFVESVILGLPIPMMFVADMDDGRLEIVDGAQRIQTLEEFMNDDFALADLDKLPSINEFRFSDLSAAQQRKLKTRALRIVVLEDETTAETRQEIFDRVNTSGERARPAEVRRGSHRGPLMDFIKECAADAVFHKLCPISSSLVKRREDEELVLRFFAYSDEYLAFRHDVNSFLDEFVKDQGTGFDRQRMEDEFQAMLRFVSQNFPYGFAKGPRAKATPRVRFEAISVGVNLALREKPGLIPANPAKWLKSEAFQYHVTTHASNSKPRLRGRVEYVRDQLLAEAD